MVDLQTGKCEHCQTGFRYLLCHAGFGDLSYAHCNSCGMLATLNLWDARWSRLPNNSSRYRKIESIVEPFLKRCQCGGQFLHGAQPRCPHCRIALSAENATVFIERNAPGASKGWGWQQNWDGLYCIAIEDPTNPGNLCVVKDPYLE